MGLSCRVTHSTCVLLFIGLKKSKKKLKIKKSLKKDKKNK